MKQFTWILILMSIFIDAHEPHPLEFVIVIPSYNNEEWVIQNLKSACFQESSHPYEVIFVNDCSTDRTGELAEEFVKEHALESMVTIIHNEKNQGVLANWYNVIHSLPDHTIVVNLDGDDMLVNNRVLLTLEEYYADPNTWLTYGKCRKYPSKKRPKWVTQLPDSYFRQRKIRKHRFVTGHLRTFRAGLFKKIKKEDLMYRGSFLTAAADVAFMIPMLDMCCPQDPRGKKHAIGAHKVLYYYRTKGNGGSISHKKKRWQQKMGRYIRSKKPYDPIDTWAC